MSFVFNFKRITMGYYESCCLASKVNWYPLETPKANSLTHMPPFSLSLQIMTDRLGNAIRNRYYIKQACDEEHHYRSLCKTVNLISFDCVHPILASFAVRSMQWFEPACSTQCVPHLRTSIVYLTFVPHLHLTFRGRVPDDLFRSSRSGSNGMIMILIHVH